MAQTDEAQISAITRAFYAAFDNRDGKAPDVAELRALFLPDARVVRVTFDAVDSWTVEAFIAPREKMLTDGTLVDFHEWEIEGETTLFDNIAARRSRYRKAGTLHGAPHAGEGRKLIQFCRAGGRWRIAGVLWEDL